MNSAGSCALRSRFNYKAIAPFVLLPILLAGCGGKAGPGSTLTGNTTLTVMATSTANDRLVQFGIAVEGITLTSKSGTTVNVLPAKVYSEFIHLNGVAEPIGSVSIPQDVYTSASVALGGAQFTCASLDSNGLQTSTNAYGQVPTSNITVTLPAPITVTGTSMGLALNLLVSPSATYANCDASIANTYTITPTFTLTPITIAAKPTNSSNGKAVGLQGLIGSIGTNGTSFTVTGGDGASPFGPSWQVISDRETVFEGIGNAAQLAAGMAVDMDLAVQPDGSLLATRVSVPNTEVENISISQGPLMWVGASEPALYAIEFEGQGHLQEVGIGGTPFSFGDATFQTSGQLANLQSLPFAASFNATNMVPGQNVSITTNATSEQGGPIYIPAGTMTLMPQTMNGTISAISSEGGFTTYTVTLASYDLFPNLASQPGQANLLTNPNTVVVYADSNTQMLNETTLTTGGVFRFHGLVFNDNGTLRMDCAQINDGVTE